MKNLQEFLYSDVFENICTTIFYGFIYSAYNKYYSLLFIHDTMLSGCINYYIKNYSLDCVNYSQEYINKVIGDRVYSIYIKLIRRL